MRAPRRSDRSELIALLRRLLPAVELAASVVRPLTGTERLELWRLLARIEEALRREG